MAKKKPQELASLLKLGDRVRIRNYSGKVGRIAELRGPLGPDGAQIYRVLVRRKPQPAYIEVREDQLEALPDLGRIHAVVPPSDRIMTQTQSKTAKHKH